VVKLPGVSGQQVVRALKRIGFRTVRQRGSHVVLRRSDPSGDIGCVVPLHRELAVGTLRSILRQARVRPETFVENL
jgi:predicted RNA binding protein YcfA (HicA-like mRNA interferase family)